MVDALRDGVILVKLVNAVSGREAPYNDGSKMAFKHMENIATFLIEAQALVFDDRVVDGCNVQCRLDGHSDERSDVSGVGADGHQKYDTQYDLVHG